MLNIVNYLEWNLNFPVFVSFIVLTLKYSNLFFSYDKLLLPWLKKTEMLKFSFVYVKFYVLF